MQIISCQNGQLQKLVGEKINSASTKAFVTELDAIDRLLPNEGFRYGAIHEILSEPGRRAGLFFAALLAKSAGGEGIIAWSDPQEQLYPPALAVMGIDLERLLILRPGDEREELWAINECLRCPGVAVTVARVGRLSRIGARRLQLAAERGGGVGLLLREIGSEAGEYAAATRWAVRPIPGRRLLQKWEVQLVHGQGGRVGQSVILEVCRETDHVRASAAVADRQVDQKTRLQSA